MTTISFVCILIIGSLILCVPEEIVYSVLACVALYFIGTFLYAIWDVLYDFFMVRPDTEEDILRKKLKKAKKDFDYDSVRLIEWELLPISTRERFVAYYKSQRRTMLLDSICSDVSQDFKEMARTELREIDFHYSTDTPPEEWDSTQNVEYLF